MHTSLMPNLRTSLECVNGANRAIARADALRATAFDSSNEDHAALLRRLWAAVFPDATGPADFTAMGFQRADPATDFRGMGLLGLHQLISLAERKRLVLMVRLPRHTVATHTLSRVPLHEPIHTTRRLCRAAHD